MESRIKSLPPAPYGLLGQRVSSAIEEIANNQGLPAEMVMGAFLMLPPICIGNACNVSYNGQWKEYANIFLLLVCESGMDKLRSVKIRKSEGYRCKFSPESLDCCDLFSEQPKGN